MAEDIIKPIGPTKTSKNDAGGGVTRSEPVIATVKNNVDPIRQGRLQVYVDDMNSPNPDDSNSWVTVSYMSPFYGKTTGSGSSSGYGEYSGNPVSYGEWHSPPDIGTKVICIFVNGDPNYGYYIGCVPEPEALTMVPAIGSVETKVTMNSGEAKGLAGATQLPVTNLNTDNTNVADSNQFLSAPKPVHSYVASVLSQQGLIRDPIRGPITSSAQRETPSRVGWGVSTPGRPIYEGGFTDQSVTGAATSGDQASGTKVISRRAGHTFVMDDGDILGKDQLIRLRTALGHQILMSDDGQCLFIIHANGQSWIELGKEGTIDMFSTNSVNIRTQGDLNLHADNNVNIHADKNININAKENININSDKETSVRTGTDYKHNVLNNFTTKVGSGMSMASGGEASYASGSTTYINGSVVNLNTGQASLTPTDVKPIPLVAQTDTLFDDEKGFAPAPAKLQTIVSRAPTHMPWAMAGKGVDVKVELGAKAALPTAPSSAVQAANNAAPSVPDNPASVATTATVPSIPSVSAALPATSAASLVSAAASQASGIAAQAVQTGTAIKDGVPQIGQLAQTASQMVTGGSLKPGSDTLINGLVAQGASVAGAMTNNLFTGQAGVTSVASFVNNQAAQITSKVTGLAQAQAQLTNVGALTGKENPGAIAGVVMAAAQNGVAQTADFIKTAASAGGLASQAAGSLNNISGAVSGALTNATGALSGAVTGAVGGALSGAAGALSGAAGSLGNLGGAVNGIAQNISAGNFASGLTNNLTSGVNGIVAGLGGAMDNAKGAVTSAFNSIVGGYKAFKPGVPQDLNAIAKGASTPGEQEVADPYAGLTQDQIDKLNGADPSDPVIRLKLGLPAIKLPAVPGLGALTSGLGSLTNGLGSLSGSISLPSVTGALQAANLSAATSGLQGISGGLNAISSVVDNAKGAVNSIPGMDAVKSAIDNTSTGLLNNIPTSLAAASSSVSSITGSLAGGVSSVTNLASTAQNLLQKGGSLLNAGSGLSSITNAASGALSGVQNSLAQGSALLSGATSLASSAGSLVSGAQGLLNKGSSLLAGAGGLAGGAGSLLSGAQGLLGNSSSLLSSVNSLLPKDLSAQLNSAIASLSSAGPVQIMMPVVAENTINRDSFTSQVSSILGNSKIPAPSYGGSSSPTSYYEAEMKKLEEKQKARDEIYKEIDAQKALVLQIRDEYQAAIDNYPPGDDAIVAQREKYYSEKKKWAELVSKLAAA